MLTSKEVFKLLSEGFTKEEIEQLEVNDGTTESNDTKGEANETVDRDSEDIKVLKDTISELKNSLDELSKNVQKDAIEKDTFETKDSETLIAEFLENCINPKKGD